MQIRRKIWNAALNSFVVVAAGMPLAAAVATPVAAQTAPGMGEAGEHGATTKPATVSSGGEHGGHGTDTVSTPAAPGTGEAGEQGAVTPSSFGATVEDVLMGEGGEHAGSMTNRSITFTALKGPEIKQLVTGNTARFHGFHAVYYAPDGSLDGWEKTYGDPVTPCPAAENPDVLIHHVPANACYQVKTNQKIGGRWQVKDDRLCVTRTLDGSATPETCSDIALIVSKVVFFDSAGKVEGGDQELARGKTLDPRWRLAY